MNKHYKSIIFILVAICLLYFARNQYSSFNLKKSVQACVIAQKKSNQDITPDEARKICEEHVAKKIKK